MRLSRLISLASALIGISVAAPVDRGLQERAQIVHPGNANSIIITSENTVNATRMPNGTHAPSAGQATTLPLQFTNNFNGFVNAYVTGLDANNNLVLLQSNGQFYYPTASSGGVPQEITANVAIPVGGEGSQLQITIPGYISAARVWFAVGDLKFYTVMNGNGQPSLVEPSSSNPNDPNAGVNWGFVELTWNPNGVFANISYVDFVGLALSMSLVQATGQSQSAGGLNPNAVNMICSALAKQAAQDGQPWDDLCMVDSSGQNLRVIAPVDYVATNPNAFSGYYDNYVNQVWSKYTNSPLTINTQNGAGNVQCQVNNNVLYCAGDNRGYNKPVIGDIWGCNSGPFAIQAGDNDIHRAVVPRLCAAFVRSTLLLDGGNVQPSLSTKSYYLNGPTMWYSAFVHGYETGGIGYAFSYDDVNADGENDSGAVSSSSPQQLQITVG